MSPYLLAIAITVVAGYLLMPLLVHRLYRAPRNTEMATPAEHGLPFETVYIATENDKTLHAWFVPPPSPSECSPAVIVMHGWGGNAEFMLPFAALFYQAGYATLLVDARNHGRSDGDTFSSLPRFAEDMEHALKWLSQRPAIDAQRIALLGHSVGAGAALLVASRQPGVAAVISIAAFAHPELLMRRQMRANHIPYRIIGWIVMRYVEHAIGSRFDAIAPMNTIRNVRCPVLLVHGCKDRKIPLADAQVIYAHRSHKRVELLILAGAGHESAESIQTQGHHLVSFLQDIVTQKRN